MSLNSFHLFNPAWRFSISVLDTLILNALKVDEKLRNLSFLDTNNLLKSEVNIGELDILFKKLIFY